MKIIFMIAIVFLCGPMLLACKNGNEGENISEKSISKVEISNSVRNGDTALVNKNINSNPSKGELKKQEQSIDITSYLPSGFVKDGSVDYTKFLQKAFEEQREILMPNFPVLINSKGLKVYSNSTIRFQNSSKLVVTKSSATSYFALNLYGVENIKIFGANIVGDRTSIIGGKIRKGQWGMGIGIRSCNNILIKNGSITNCWGDGIYLGKYTGSKEDNINITIKGVHISNVRRNGISIISGSNINISDVYISHVNGISPSGGIDFEPNSQNDILQHIVLNNIHTSNNRYGILISLKELIGANPKSVQISISNHTDSASVTPFRIAGYKITKKNNIGESLNGLITIKNCYWKNNTTGLSVDNTQNKYPKIVFEGVKKVNGGLKAKNNSGYLDRLRKSLTNETKIQVKN